MIPLISKRYFILGFLFCLPFLYQCQSGLDTKPIETVVDTLHQSSPDVKTVPDQSKKVLGWHRDSKGENARDYDYSIINMLAYFSYQVDPETGENKKPIDWHNAPVIDSAQANNCKVYLTIENFGAENNRKFLPNPEARKTLIKNCIRLLKYKNAAGICVDFEAVPKSSQTAYNDFLKQLGDSLRSNAYDLVVVLQLYEPENRVNPALIDHLVDYYVMMGYACYHKNSHSAGPISPLYSGEIWEPYSLAPNIEAYLSKGFPSEKFMVALPLYGGVWETESGTIPSKSVEGISNPTVNTIMTENSDQTIHMDSTSKSNYYTVLKQNKHYQYWFEGPVSLAQKVEYIKQKELAGIGLWALGYAEDNKAIWSSIATIHQQ